MEPARKTWTPQELNDILFNIRESLHIIQIQQEVMKEAVDKCNQLSPEKYKECMLAINIAHKEILHFLEQNVQLAKYIDELRSYVADQESGKTD